VSSGAPAAAGPADRPGHLVPGRRLRPRHAQALVDPLGRPEL